MNMKRYYMITCVKCKYIFKWDEQNPNPCRCGCVTGVYMGHNVTLKDTKKELTNEQA